MLLVNMSRSHVPTGTIPPVALTCEVCLANLTSMAEMITHLNTVHKLEINDWVPHRDMLHADPVCAHCYARFAEKSALRQHIARGQCPSFDPLRIPDEPEVPDNLRQVLLDLH